jgi:hypothetical protein
MEQNGRTVKVHLSEHIRYIKPNNSASTMHTRNMSHSYRPTESTMELIEYSKYRWKTNVDENLHTQLHKKTSTVISEQYRRSITPSLKLSTNCKHLTQAHKHSRVPSRSLTILPAQSVRNHSQQPHLSFCIHTHITE